MDAAALIKMWCNVRWHNIYRPRWDLWRAVNVGRLLRPTTNIAEYALGAIRWTWLLDTAPARRTLTGYLGGPEITPSPDLTVIVSAVDESTGEVIRFCTELPPEHRADATFRQVALSVDHVMASAAVPLLFPPGRGRGGDCTSASDDACGADAHRLVDAGMVANTPLAPAMRYEPDRVIVVSGGGITRPAPPPDSLGAAMALLVDNVSYFALTADLAHAETVNRLVRAAPATTDKREVPMLLIEPTDLGFSLNGFLHFTPGQARRIIEYGRDQAEKALAGWNA
jgi:NTE family protein